MATSPQQACPSPDEIAAAEEAIRSALHRIFPRRGIELHPEDSAWIDACPDLPTLERWLQEALARKRSKIFWSRTSAGALLRLKEEARRLDRRRRARRAAAVGGAIKAAIQVIARQILEPAVDLNAMTAGLPMPAGREDPFGLSARKFDLAPELAPERIAHPYKGGHQHVIHRLRQRNGQWSARSPCGRFQPP